MKVHKLKTENPFFCDLWSDKKNFEIRFDDRKFKEGDILHLCEYNRANSSYSGREIIAVCEYVLRNYPTVKKEYVIISIKIVGRITA